MCPLSSDFIGRHTMIFSKRMAGQGHTRVFHDRTRCRVRAGSRANSTIVRPERADSRLASCRSDHGAVRTKGVGPAKRGLAGAPDERLSFPQPRGTPHTVKRPLRPVLLNRVLRALRVAIAFRRPSFLTIAAVSTMRSRSIDRRRRCLQKHARARFRVPSPAPEARRPAPRARRDLSSRFRWDRRRDRPTRVPREFRGAEVVP